MPARVIRSTRVLTARGLVPAALHVEDGRIARITAADEDPDSTTVDDLGDLVVMPGVVDTHVHVNEPGRSEWEGFETATAAAAAGGVTTIVDMPLNSVPATTDAAALDAKRRAAEGRIHVDVGFWGGVIPGNAADLEPLARAGALGFKAFLVPSGVDEFPAVGEADLREALPIVARLGLPLLAHAELPGPIEQAVTGIEGADTRAYATWLASRPPAAELQAIELLVALSREFRARIHIVHLAAAEALPALTAARAEGLPITVETCPHYLTFASEEIADGATTLKCAPPIRGRANRDALAHAAADGRIDLVATDHSPCPPSMKCVASGDFMRAWGGIASLELGLRASWTRLAKHGVTLERLADLMCAAPARLAGLAHRKGRIAEGFDADLVVWDPDDATIVDAGRLVQRHKLTPYDGLGLRGTIHRTYLGGRIVWCQAVNRESERFGQLLRGHGVRQ